METKIMSTEKAIGRLIKGLNCSYAVLGEKLNVTRYAVYKWHKGKSRPTIDHIKLLINLGKKNDIPIKAEDFLG